MSEVTPEKKTEKRGKKARQGLSIGPDLLDRAKRERPLAQANFSEYVRRLVVADLDREQPLDPVKDHSILATLAGRLLDGLEAQRLSAALDAMTPAVDQREVLQLWLRSYLASLKTESVGFVAEDRTDEMSRRLAAAIAEGLRQPSPARPPTAPPHKPAGKG